MKNIFLLFGLLFTRLLHAQTHEEESVVEVTTGLTMQQIENLYITRSFVKDIDDELVVLDSVSIKKEDKIKVGQFLCCQLYSISRSIRIIDSNIVKK